VPGTETRGPIRFHKIMAWIHGPGMIATPILGIMAFDQKTKGKKSMGLRRRMARALESMRIVTRGELLADRHLEAASGNGIAVPGTTT